MPHSEYPWGLAPDKVAAIEAQSRLYGTAVREALEATHGDGLKIMAALEGFETALKSFSSREEAYDQLAIMWKAVHPHLFVVKAAHAGALAYFVEIKDSLKAQIERRWPTPAREDLPLR